MAHSVDPDESSLMTLHCLQKSMFSSKRLKGLRLCFNQVEQSFPMALDKMGFFFSQNSDISPVSLQKHMLWYLLEVTLRTASNDYSQHMFLWRNKKHTYLIATLI